MPLPRESSKKDGDFFMTFYVIGLHFGTGIYHRCKSNTLRKQASDYTWRPYVLLYDGDAFHFEDKKLETQPRLSYIHQCLLG